MPPWMEDFFSNHIVLFFLIIGYLIYRLSKGLGSGSLKGLKTIAAVVVVILILMALRNPSSLLPSSGQESKGFWWAIGHYGGVAGSAIATMDGAGSGMMGQYRNCLFYYVVHRNREARMRAVCPLGNAANPNAAFESCMEKVLGEQDTDALGFCQDNYQGVKGLTHELMLGFCTTFPKLCAAPK